MRVMPVPVPGVAEPSWRRRRWLACAASTAAGAFVSPSAQAQFRVEIGGIGATQVPVAIARLRDETTSGVAISSVVRADLERSGAFRVSDGGAGLDERSAPALAEWRQRGVDALLGGSVTRLADGRLDVRFALWDAVKATLVGAQSMVVGAGEARAAAHRIADALQLALLGVRGVASTRIAYVTLAGGRHTLRVADADGEGGHVALTSAQPVISPAWSPDGRQLAYVSFESGKAVVMVQDIATGTRRVVAAFRGSNSAPAWLPDGQAIAAALSRDGGAAIFRMNLQGENLKRLTQSAAIDTEPVFSSDGRWMVFVSDRGGGPQIYRQPADGGAAERLTFHGAYNVSPTLSPDGRTLAYVTRDAGFRVMALALDTPGATPWRVSDTADDERPTFAPNGRLLMYATRSGGRDALMAATLDGRTRTRLLATSADVREPAWGPFGAPLPPLRAAP